MHDLTGPGRAVLDEAGKAGSPENRASPPRHLTDATSIAEAPPRRPRPLSSRPGRDDLVELLISDDGRHAAVDIDDLPVHEVRGARGEEHGRTAQLVGIAPPPRRHPAAKPRIELRIAPERLGQLGAEV